MSNAEHDHPYENQPLIENKEDLIQNEEIDQNIEEKSASESNKLLINPQEKKEEVEEEELIQNNNNNLQNQIDFFNLNEEELDYYLSNLGINETTLNIIKENKLDFYDLFSLSLNPEEFNNLLEKNIHDKNIILKLINKEIEKILKIKIILEDNSEIYLSLENDLNYTVENLTNNLINILNLNNNKIFLTLEKDENNILLPNIKIVDRLLKNPE